MADQVTFRAATADDLDDILLFWGVAAEDAHRPADSSAALRQLLDRDPDALRLAFDGTALVGTVVAGYDGWRCHLYRLAVHPAHRRRGIAAALLAWANGRFVALGGNRADAMILDDNTLAQHAWRSAGFTRQDEWARWVRPLP